MNSFELAYLELSFRAKFMEMDGTAFQSFFSDIMERRYPGDFQRIRPWGNEGDRKNDGYHRSKRRLFQVYAPKAYTKSALLSKLEEDFLGAIPHWKDYFDTWIFVHNDRDGIGPFVLEKLHEFESTHKPIKCIGWGFTELRAEFISLSQFDMASLVGFAISDRDVQDLRYEDLRLVLENIQANATAIDPDLRPVPPNKIRANALSDSVTTLL